MKKTTRRRQNNDGTLWFYGDSASRRFHYDIVNTSVLCSGIFGKCDGVVNKIYNKKPGESPFDAMDLNLTRVRIELEDMLREPSLNNSNSAIVINYGLHYVMDTPFSVFVDAMETVGRTLHKFKSLVKGTIIWKTTNAINKWKCGWPHPDSKHSKEQRFLTEPVSLALF